MNYIKKFESFESNDIRGKVDDIAAYMPTETTKVGCKWIPTNFDVTKIFDDTASGEKLMKNHSDLEFVRYYSFGFNELDKFFMVESEIKNRASSFKLNFIVLNFNSPDNRYRILFFTEEDWVKFDKDNIVKVVNKKEWDVLFEEDVKIDRTEFDILYEDDEILAIKPKTYKAAIRYSSDSNWKIALKKNKDWIDKYVRRSSYYGGYNWYKSIKKADIQSWWNKILKIPKKSDTQVKDFINDFPRYLLYIVIFKRVPAEDDMNKLYLLYDVSRSEYGELPKSFSSNYVMFGGYYGDMLDAAHNQVKIVKSNNRKTTLRDIHSRHGSLFNRAFRQIEYDFNEEKDKLYDILGFWSDIGGEYRDDALVFIRSSNEPDRLQVTRPSLINKDKEGLSWRRLGYYDDDNFDYWELNKKPTVDKEIPNGGNGYKNYFDSVNDNVAKLKAALEIELGNDKNK